MFMHDLYQKSLLYKYFTYNFQACLKIQQFVNQMEFIATLFFNL